MLCVQWCYVKGPKGQKGIMYAAQSPGALHRKLPFACISWHEYVIEASQPLQVNFA